VLMSKKGFSMLEVLASICIISAFMLLSISNTNRLNLDHYDFMNNYLLTQTEAIVTKQEQNYTNGVHFNSMGHINQARTINFENHNVIVHLGNGYVTLD